MYGRYTKDLGEYAKEEARKLKYHEKARRKYDKTRAEDLRKSRRGPLCRKLLALLAFTWKHTGARLGEDWIFLALLGIIMALISYAMDRGISMCNNGQSTLFSGGNFTPECEIFNNYNITIFTLKYLRNSLISKKISIYTEVVMKIEPLRTKNND